MQKTTRKPKSKRSSSGSKRSSSGSKKSSKTKKLKKSSKMQRDFSEIEMMKQKIAFLSHVLQQEDFLNPDILRKINSELNNTKKKYNKAAKLIQKKYKQYQEKKYDKEMEESGYFKLPCGIWSNGAQCMCDECMDF